ncbi:MAG TPA: TAXI family TRAP transporter solute-binding subunit, partial [Steroidobacteraceae bacterium]|nr:TAXI family TRAP transporter solute-binding subunit [Steroidobacteraceae bacterium]
MSWRDLAHTLIPILAISAIAIFVALHFASPAPPRELTMSSGPAGSTFDRNAKRYQSILARSGVTLHIVQSNGSLQNLERLVDRHSGVDIAFVQSGLPANSEASDLVSLGSMFFEPLTVFYRSPRPLERLSGLESHRIAIGREGSGARILALALLQANGIEPQGSTKLLSLEDAAGKDALLKGQVDAIFLAGDSASTATMRELEHAPGIRLFDFKQADAYVRRFTYLHRIVIPAGAFDLGENLPATDTNMLAPTVELVARSRLHPALTDLLIEAAFEVHSRATLLQTAGEFPNQAAPLFPLSPEAARYYRSGNKMLTYRFLPFWLASLFNRLVLVLVPVIVVLVPGLRYLPQLYGWRISRRIHRRYGELMALERKSLGPLSEEERGALLERLEHIEKSVIRDKTPGSHAEQLYILREHIGLARAKLTRPGMPFEAHAPAAASRVLGTGERGTSALAAPARGAPAGARGASTVPSVSKCIPGRFSFARA